MPVSPDTLKMILSSLWKFGIKNPKLQAGILAVISKETGFNLRSESSYSGTSAQRLRFIFGKRLKDLSDEQLNQLKLNDQKFFDYVYGGRYGNTSPGDGFKYRGRGFNQITFKDLYKKYGEKIGVDLVNNPERMNEPKIASDVLGAYFAEAIRSGEVSGKMKEKTGIEKASDVPDLDTAVRIAVQANAGWGTSSFAPVVLEGLKKAREAVSGFSDFISLNPLIPVFPDPTSLITDPAKKKRIRKALPYVLGSLALLGVGIGLHQTRKA